MKKLMSVLCLLFSISPLQLYADQNLTTCLLGKYPILCKHDQLSPSEAKKVNAAELRENLRTCLLGKYPILCKHDLLIGSQVDVVQQAEHREATKISTTSRPSTKQHYARSGGCDSGHWVDSVSDDGDIVKLEDGSIWEVDAGDTVDSMLWLPTTDILACPHKLINTEDNETVGATRLK